jgi:hypothetical protein
MISPRRLVSRIHARSMPSGDLQTTTQGTGQGPFDFSKAHCQVECLIQETPRERLLGSLNAYFHPDVSSRKKQKMISGQVPENFLFFASE